MKPSEIIDKALTEHLARPDQWMQGDLFNADGSRCCMAGALYKASGCVITTTADGLSYNVSEPEGWRQNDYWDALAVAQRVAGERYDLDMVTISSFNDAHDRTYDDVREVLEKARAGLQEQGQ